MPFVFFRRTDDGYRVRMNIFVIITKKMSIPLRHLVPRNRQQEKRQQDEDVRTAEEREEQAGLRPTGGAAAACGQRGPRWL